MKEIPHIYQGVDRWSILPNIKSTFVTLDSNRSFTSQGGETTYGELMPPIFVGLLESSAFILDETLENLRNDIKFLDIKDQDGEVITEQKLSELFKSYSEGFQNGYFDFEDRIKKNESTLFKMSTEERAKRIFEVVTKFPMITGIGFETNLGDTERLRKLTTKTMITEGFSFGEIYKAWEIILNNQKLFEPLFEKRKSKMTSSKESKKQTQKNKDSLTLREIALLYVYNSDQIHERNRDEIAKDYSHTSGHKLAQHYNKFRFDNERTGFEPYETTKIKNQIERINKVLKLIREDKGRQKAQTDLSKLNSLLHES